MSWIKKTIEYIIGNENISDIKSSTLRDFLNGNILKKKFIQRQYGLIILVAVFAFLYIDNRYYCENQFVRMTDLQKKIQNLKYESLTNSAELMQMSRFSNVTRLINENGSQLVRSTNPPVEIKDSTRLTNGK